MKRNRVKGFCGVFTPLGAAVVIILFTAVICVLVGIVGIVQNKTGGRMTLLSTTITKFDNCPPTLEQSDEWQTVRMRVTAYCPCPKCCGKYSGGPTACGHKICQGDTFVAADKRYSFGTEMLIPGYNNGKTVKVLDRGGAIKGDRLDVFFTSHKEALEWGVRYLDVRVRLVPKI
ncbi:MAG: 3D domain-containing protein [Sedimentisphaerales bacterium]|nr:3D domain-containing protein [Sedimentisphaerales bacterium]